MQIKVSEDTFRFYIASEKWVPVVGHEIKVGEHKFCAIPNTAGICVAEVTSGIVAMNIKSNILMVLETFSKEKTILYFEDIGKRIQKAIEVNPNFEENLKIETLKVLERLGEMPPIEKVDIHSMLRNESTTYH
ncbi:hypothetical protein BTS2_0494 [Bacillus sp. TS-2]|nr:hypothetical protein BTS2_0494 [Bacillus sp. TS-2]